MEEFTKEPNFLIDLRFNLLKYYNRCKNVKLKAEAAAPERGKEDGGEKGGGNGEGKRTVVKRDKEAMCLKGKMYESFFFFLIK